MSLFAAAANGNKDQTAPFVPLFAAVGDLTTTATAPSDVTVPALMPPEEQSTSAFIPTASVSSFPSFASAPDLNPAPTPRAAVAPTHVAPGSSKAKAKAKAKLIDLTAADSDSEAEEERKEEKQRKRKRKKEKRRSRSRDRNTKRSRSRSKERKRKQHRKEKSKHDKRDRSRSPEDRKRRKREQGLNAQVEQHAPVAMSLSESGSSSDSDIEALEHELSVTAASRAAERAAAEAAADHAKILAIEQRLKDESLRTSYLHPPSYMAHVASSAASSSHTHKRQSGWVLDARGDINNLVFQCLYRTDIPRYDAPANRAELLGASQVGLLTIGDVRALLRPIRQQRQHGSGRASSSESVAIRLDRIVTEQEEIHATKHTRYFAHKYVLRERDRTFKRVRVRRAAATPDDELSEGKDFISLYGEDLGSAAASSYSAAASASIAEPAVPSTDGESFEDHCLALTRTYNAALRIHPHNIKLWLAFIAAQQDVLHPFRRVSSGAALRSRQLAIYRRAIHVNPQSETLWMGMTATAMCEETPDEAAALFKEAFAALPNSIPLRQAYCRFLCAPVSTRTFRADSGPMHQALADVLHAMTQRRRELVRQWNQRSTVGESIEQLRANIRSEIHELNRSLLHQLSEYIDFLVSCGYTDRALALWQCSLDFNVFPASRLSSDLASNPHLHRQYLQAYWESDVARFGEEDAPTFAGWYEKLMAGQQQPEARDPYAHVERQSITITSHTSNTTLPVDEWLQAEAEMERVQWAPLRDAPRVFTHPCEAPHSALQRVVLYDELESCICDWTGMIEDGVTPTMLDMDLHACTVEFALRNLTSILQLPPTMLLPPGGLFLNSLYIMQSGHVGISCYNSDAPSTPSMSLRADCFESVPGVAGTLFPDPLLVSLDKPTSSPSLVDVALPTSGDYAGIDVERLRTTSASDAALLLSLLASPNNVSFIRRVMQQLLTAFPQSDVLRTCWLTMEYSLCLTEKMNAQANQRADTVAQHKDTREGHNPSTASASVSVNAPLYPFSTPRSLIKTFLQDDPSNLLLLNSYALLEYHHGFPSRACGIYERTRTALSSSSMHGISSDGIDLRPILFWSFANMQFTRACRLRNEPLPSGMDETDADQEADELLRYALHILLCASDGVLTPFDANGSVRPTRIIKARNAFQHALIKEQNVSWSVAATPVPLGQDASPDRHSASSTSGLTVSSAACLCACYMYMEYLSQGLEAVKHVWDEVILKFVCQRDDSDSASSAAPVNGFIRGGLQHEWLQTMYIRLLTFHRSRHRSYPPRVFRQALVKALDVFPGNGFFLSQLVESYRGAGFVTTDLRRTLDRILQGDNLDPDDATQASSLAIHNVANKQHGLTEDERIDALVQQVNAAPSKRPVPHLAWLHAISADLQRPGAAYRIEALLERALQHQSSGIAAVGANADSALTASHFPPLLFPAALWRLFIRYYVCKGRIEAASKLLPRATRACPCSKRLWMDGITWIHEAQHTQATHGGQEEKPSVNSNTSGVAALAPRTFILTADDVAELYVQLQEKELRHRVNLLPETEADAEYRPLERAWDRHMRRLREKEEEKERAERSRLYGRGAHQTREVERRSRSRSRSSGYATHSGSSGRSRSRSRDRSYARDRYRRRHRRSRSRSTSPSDSDSSASSDSNLSALDSDDERRRRARHRRHRHRQHHHDRRHRQHVRKHRSSRDRSRSHSRSPSVDMFGRIRRKNPTTPDR